MNYYLSVDIGGSSIKYGVIDENGHLSEQGKIQNNRESAQDFVRNILSIQEKLSKEISGICLSFAGTVDRMNSDIFNGATFPFLENQNMETLFQKETDLPVSVVNDAVAAALAEKEYGVLQGISNAITIVLGTGIGCCLMVNGQIVEGAHHFSGQVSMIKTDGNKTGLEETWGWLNGKDGLLREVQKVMNTEQKYTGFEIFDLAEQGNEKVLEALGNYCRRIAVVLYNMQCVLDVDKIVIGGGISARKILLDTIQKDLDQMYQTDQKYHFPTHKPILEACKFNNDANLIGAYVHFKEKYQ